MTNKICGIYLISNDAGEQYVGQSINIHGRWRDHAKRFLTSEWTYEVLCECKPEDLNYSEIKCIQYFGSHRTNPGGLNKTPGGNGWHPMIGRAVSAETKAKLSAANKGKLMSDEAKAKMSKAKKGMSDETRAKMSEAKKGNKLSPEHKAKLSAALKGRRSPTEGKPRSDETRAKQSAALKGKPLSPETKELRRLNREKKKCLK